MLKNSCAAFCCHEVSAILIEQEIRPGFLTGRIDQIKYGLISIKTDSVPKFRAVGTGRDRFDMVDIGGEESPHTWLKKPSYAVSIVDRVLRLPFGAVEAEDKDVA